MARAMGATLMGLKNGLVKIKFVTSIFFNLFFAAHTTMNCRAASIQRPYL